MREFHPVSNHNLKGAKSQHHWWGGKLEGQLGLCTDCGFHPFAWLHRQARHRRCVGLRSASPAWTFLDLNYTLSILSHDTQFCPPSPTHPALLTVSHIPSKWANRKFALLGFLFSSFPRASYTSYCLVRWAHAITERAGHFRCGCG
jgi:hypothetical protein